ncbi:unnamed protein product, partial [Coregonus sp. 'balchen']
MPTTFNGSYRKFSEHMLKSGMFRDNGFNTSIEKSKITGHDTIPMFQDRINFNYAYDSGSAPPPPPSPIASLPPMGCRWAGVTPVLFLTRLDTRHELTQKAARSLSPRRRAAAERTRGGDQAEESESGEKRRSGTVSALGSQKPAPQRSSSTAVYALAILHSANGALQSPC